MKKLSFVGCPSLIPMIPGSVEGGPASPGGPGGPCGCPCGCPGGPESPGGFEIAGAIPGGGPEMPGGGPESPGGFPGALCIGGGSPGAALFGLTGTEDSCWGVGGFDTLATDILWDPEELTLGAVEPKNLDPGPGGCGCGFVDGAAVVVVVEGVAAGLKNDENLELFPSGFSGFFSSEDGFTNEKKVSTSLFLGIGSGSAWKNWSFLRRWDCFHFSKSSTVSPISSLRLSSKFVELHSGSASFSSPNNSSMGGFFFLSKSFL